MVLDQGSSEQYQQLIQQLIELQREKNELRTYRENVPNRSYTKKPYRLITKYGYNDGDWALFINSFTKQLDFAFDI